MRLETVNSVDSNYAEWKALDRVLDSLEKGGLVEALLSNLTFLQKDDLGDLIAYVALSSETLTKFELSKVELNKAGSVACAIYDLASDCNQVTQITLTESILDDDFTGAIISILKTCKNIVQINLTGCTISDNAIESLKKTKLEAERKVVLTLPDGSQIDSFEMAQMTVVKQAPRRLKRFKGIEINARIFSDYPRLLVKGTCGRILPSEYFYYCVNCETLSSKFQVRKEISFFFNPTKVEIINHTSKVAFGKNPNEKLCPVCLIYITDENYTVEVAGSEEKQTKIYAYFKCKHCLWNTNHYNLSYETPKLNKFTLELYRKHKKARDDEINWALNFIQDKLNMTNRAIMHEESIIDQTLFKRNNLHRNESLELSSSKGWDKNKLYARWEKEKSKTLSSQALKSGKENKDKYISLYPQQEETDESDKEDSKQEKEGENEKKIEEKTEENKEEDSSQVGPTLGLPPASAPGKRRRSLLSESNLNELNIDMKEIEAKTNEIFKDNELIMGELKTQEDQSQKVQIDNIDDFLNDYKPKEIFSNIYEHLPTKVFDGQSSLIAISSYIVPVMRKSCPVETCKNGLAYYEKSSEFFSLKFHSTLSEFTPIIRMTKVSRASSTNPKSTLTFSALNRSKGAYKLILRLEEDPSACTFGDGTDTFEAQLTTKDGPNVKISFDLQVDFSLLQQVNFKVEIEHTDRQARMEGTEQDGTSSTFKVAYSAVMQFGDETEREAYLAKFYPTN